MNAFRFALSVVACAALTFPLGCSSNVGSDDPAEPDEAASTEDELRALTRSEIAGTIDPDGAFHSIDVPAYRGRNVYRALAFKASAGDAFVADVVATDGTDPVAYVLGSDFATLARNDDASATSKNPHISFKATKAGTYYLAVRTKQAKASRYSVKLSVTESYRDAWPASVAERYRVRIESPTGWGVSNGGTCPVDAQPVGYTAAQSFECQVDLASDTISCHAASQILGASAKIAHDGTFVIDQADGRERTLVRGRLEAGGVVSVSFGFFSHCGRNVDDFVTVNVAGLTDGRGTAKAL